MENNNSNSNAVLIIVVGLLAFLGFAIVGKWLLTDKHDNRRFEKGNMSQPAQQPPVQQPAPPTVIVQPPPETIIIGRPYPQTYSQFHARNEFWQGYSDGWNGLLRRQNNPEYNQGYLIGVHDRKCGKPIYHDQNCPPGFSLRVPGFSLNIR